MDSEDDAAACTGGDQPRPPRRHRGITAPPIGQQGIDIGTRRVQPGPQLTSDISDELPYRPNLFRDNNMPLGGISPAETTFINLPGDPATTQNPNNHQQPGRSRQPGHSGNIP
ncbi:hypothetical protein [Nocardia donostiensis]|uniref:Uncharacterized protein n=1 Tax=Nocardia donostiensis TaxID=1538463 RepID=A0A1W0B7S5_9NOCA|nr:hypothetical protein [Nocardia donostiensis]ONM46247.1 hypothetical protein B0T46_23990 [Nocardia donostiensis]OQS13328.1 hypothetical protein B0T36_19605 [Nocardia donostiensis]OQS18428.1 hypothetical protein B0T44_19700 [Nocardia donostiensis]